MAYSEQRPGSDVVRIVCARYGQTVQPTETLLNCLRRLVLVDARDGMDGHRPPLVSAFVMRERECVKAFRAPTPGLVVVIEGRKHVAWGGAAEVCIAGDALFLPADAVLDVVNEPDEATGVYRALFLQFPRALLIEAARRWPEFACRDPDPAIARLTPQTDLGSAIVHVGEALEGCSPRIVAHRMLGVLVLLAELGVVRFAPKYVERSVHEAVRLLIRHRLDQPWSAGTLASALGMSEATLRRRLSAEGESFRGLLRAERMAAARLLLAERTADVAQAMAATGYASRSHFTRHFKDAYGELPSRSRRARAIAAH